MKICGVMKKYLISCKYIPNEGFPEPKTKYIPIEAVSTTMAIQKFQELYGDKNFKIIKIYKELDVKSNV